MFKMKLFLLLLLSLCACSRFYASQQATTWAKSNGINTFSIFCDTKENINYHSCTLTYPLPGNVIVSQALICNSESCVEVK